MIYQATWADGRQLTLRANDEEAARKFALYWREGDPMYDGDVNHKVFTLTFIPSRGRPEVINAGWTPHAYATAGADPMPM